jgi:uncharacterized phage protein (TIGR01671 family)
MREIKFRAWDGNRMLKHVEFFTTPQGWIWDDNQCKVGVKDVMQFTGLLDKNGKEIYEGDIVETDHNVRFGTTVLGRGRSQKTYPKEKEIVEGGIVEYNEGEWIVRFNSYHDYFSYFWVASSKDRPKHIHEQVIEHIAKRSYRYEVISNIYESPELMEVSP